MHFSTENFEEAEAKLNKERIKAQRKLSAAYRDNNFIDTMRIIQTQERKIARIDLQFALHEAKPKEGDFESELYLRLLGNNEIDENYNISNSL